MSSGIEKVKGICFDFGNTLVEFGSAQYAYEHEVLVNTLEENFGPCELGDLKTIRDKQIVKPFYNGYVENNIRDICYELVREIYEIIPSESEVDKIIEARHDAFVNSIESSNEVKTLLRKLSNEYCLGLLSNYPCSRSIISSLDKLGLLDCFNTIVISGDVGFVKPHKKPFNLMLSNLQLSAQECVYVGDNWLADIQGAKRIGLQAILTKQYLAYESFTPEKGDFPPDREINHILELENIFLGQRA